MGRGKISRSGVSPKWVKSKRHRKKEKKEKRSIKLFNLNIKQFYKIFINPLPFINGLGQSRGEVNEGPAHAVFVPLFELYDWL